jgi:hypothetical protein
LKTAKPHNKGVAGKNLIINGLPVDFISASIAAVPDEVIGT